METMQGYAVDRELIAYGLIGVTILVAAPWGWATWRRRQRQKLRRRGIKTYGH